MTVDHPKYARMMIVLLFFGAQVLDCMCCPGTGYLAERHLCVDASQILEVHYLRWPCTCSLLQHKGTRVVKVVKPTFLE